MPACVLRALDSCSGDVEEVLAERRVKRRAFRRFWAARGEDLGVNIVTFGGRVGAACGVEIEAEGSVEDISFLFFSLGSYTDLAGREGSWGGSELLVMCVGG